MNLKDPCADCLHFSECSERRGRCREYKDLKGVIEDIEMLNQKAKLTACSEADKADNRQGGAGDKPPFGGKAREAGSSSRSKEEAPDAYGGNHGISAEEGGSKTPKEG